MENNQKVDYSSNDIYTVKFPLWALNHIGEKYHFYYETMYYKVQPTDTNKAVELIKDFQDMQMTTGEVLTLDLTDFFSDSDLDTLRYDMNLSGVVSSTTDQVLFVTITDSELRIEVNTTASIGDVTTVELYATDDKQINPTTTSFVVTVIGS